MICGARGLSQLDGKSGCVLVRFDLLIIYFHNICRSIHERRKFMFLNLLLIVRVRYFKCAHFSRRVDVVASSSFFITHHCGFQYFSAVLFLNAYTPRWVQCYSPLYKNSCFFILGSPLVIIVIASCSGWCKKKCVEKSELFIAYSKCEKKTNLINLMENCLV